MVECFRYLQFFRISDTDTALIGSISALSLGRQYVAITQKARAQIRIIKESNVEDNLNAILSDILCFIIYSIVFCI